MQVVQLRVRCCHGEVLHCNDSCKRASTVAAAALVCRQSISFEGGSKRSEIVV